MRIRTYIGVMVAAVICTAITTGGAVFAAANDFTISRYDMKLELGRDSEQRSTLKTTETITAQFPESDQNHGIERAIPTAYDGHTTSLQIESVKSDSGADLPYTTYESGNNTVVRIGEADAYVHGAKTYVLTYTQRDVTRYYVDTGRDEFYWDLNGVDWKVPIRQFTAQLTLDSGLSGALQQAVCYRGMAGAQTSCRLDQEGTVFRTSADSLTAGENVTVALGFTKGVFGVYQPSPLERLLPWWIGAMVVSGAVSFVALIWAMWRLGNQKNRLREIGTIVPEYLPPKEASVTTSAEVIDTPRAVLAAQLMDFAVRHYLRIIETKEKTFWSNAEYTLEILKPIDTLRAEEQELLRDMFDGDAAVGRQLEMKKLQNNTALYSRMQDNPGKLKKLVRGNYALRSKDPVRTKWFTRLAQVLLLLGVVTLAPLTIVLAGVIWLMGYTLWPLTDKGLVLRRYLDGMKLYIGVAEEERLKLLQSPEGAEKVGRHATDSPGKIVKLYERMLPYAVLFGQEKEWSKQLGSYYESAGSSPEWYAGSHSGVFNAAVLSSAMSNFSTTSAYTSASSSSSGGSGGGGSSGGGGGGGGGGGW